MNATDVMADCQEYDNHISLGCNCHPAYWLRELGLRTSSMPFDWLLGSPEHFMHFVNESIQADFAGWPSLLTLNQRGKVVCELYPYIELFHHQCLLDEEQGIAVREVLKLKRRAKRFMDALGSFNSYYIFYPMFKWRSHRTFLDELSRFATFASGRVVVYYVSDVLPDGQLSGEDDHDAFVSLINQYPDMPINTCALFHKRDRRVHSIWGQEPDFLRPCSIYRVRSRNNAPA